MLNLFILFLIFSLNCNPTESLVSHKEAERAQAAFLFLWQSLMARGDNSVDKTRNQEVGFLISVVRDLPLVGRLAWSSSLKLCVKVYLTVKE